MGMGVALITEPLRFFRKLRSKMVRLDSKSSSPVGDIQEQGVLTYPYVVLVILLLLTVGATLVYYQNAAVFEDLTGARWTPVVFLIGVGISLVIFAMTHREAAARAVLHNKTLDLIEAQKVNHALLVAEQNARREAENANRAKDEFLAVVSHELKTPLHAIAGWNRVLKTEGISEEMYKAAIEKIDKNVRLQTAIIDELLSFSEMVSGPQTIDVRAVSMRDVFEDATAAVGIAAFQKGITLDKANNLIDEQVSGDSARLRIALVNVLSNAVKFTPPGGCIEAKAFKSNGFVKCVIVDNGEGIPEDLIPHVFEQYRQSELASTRHYGGLGLGLTIADQIIRLHNGTIKAESSGPGTGSTFTIALPAIADLRA